MKMLQKFSTNDKIAILLLVIGGVNLGTGIIATVVGHEVTAIVTIMCAVILIIVAMKIME